MATPFETTTSKRYSARDFTTEAVGSQQLLSVLWASYGYTDSGRVLQKIGNDYSLVVFPVNATGSYRYEPETNSLMPHNTAVNKETIRPYMGWPSNANVVLVIVWNQTRMNNQYFASAEAGCLVQNVHLAAISENLGTTAVGTIDSAGLRNVLGLPSSLIPILVMPLGYPVYPYPQATPDYGRMTGNLPTVQIGQLSFADALNNMRYVQAWSSQSLSLQELSQLLWAAYGYSSTGHRTTPSANGIYPLVVYVSNATGTYRYVPDNHSVQLVKNGDNRLDLANAYAGNVWAANAPAILLVSYNSAYNGGNTGDGGPLPHEYIEVNTGCVVQQLLLEASTLNISANVLSEGLEDWNGPGATALRNILTLSSSHIPLYAVPVGHVDGSPSPSPSYSPSPSPSQFPAPSPSPQPTSTPFPSPTQSPSQSPESPEMNPLYFFVTIAGVIVLIIVAFARVLKKRQ